MKKLLPILLLIFSCEEVLDELADTTSPSIIITYPANQTTLTEITTVRADVIDDNDIEYVKFIIDGAEAFSDSTAPYEYSWDVCVQSTGTHTLLVKASDSAQNEGQSELYSFTINATYDCAEVCGGDAVQDCLGNCEGSAELDNCGTCDSNIINDCKDDSWMLTSINTKYVYTVAQPGYSNGFSWPADSSYGIKVRWNYAHYLPDAYKTSTDAWIIKVQHDDTTLYTESMIDLAQMQASNIGLIAVFENSNNIVNDETFKMKGVYPGIFYNYSICATAVSTAPITDQGLYSMNLSNISNNFSIKRDPSILGSQVIPPFNDGSITVNDSILNIKFLDRSSHSIRYSEVMDSWDEGTHPDVGNGINSGGDRTYMAFPQMVLDEDGAFVAAYDGSAGTTPASEGYYKSPMFVYWGGYMTYYAFVYNAESGLLKSGMVSGVDSDSNGMITDTEVVVYMVTYPDNTLSSDPTIKYSDIVTIDSITGAPKFTDDSAGDYSPTNGAAGGKMTFDVIIDCAVPVDVTIDYDLKFKKCATENCVSDNYHINPTWD